MSYCIGLDGRRNVGGWVSGWVGEWFTLGWAGLRWREEMGPWCLWGREGSEETRPLNGWVGG